MTWCGCVRKHRAPKGALRQAFHPDELTLRDIRQEAPSAKRCIKTRIAHSPVVGWPVGQEAPSAKRCIKTGGTLLGGNRAVHGSGSTERQKVH